MKTDGRRFLWYWLLVIEGFLCLLWAGQSQAEDVLIRQRGNVGVVRRMDFSDIVLAEAMRRTTGKYGPYRIETVAGSDTRERMLHELANGQLYNTTVVASQPSWEQQLLPIWIPIDMGLSNYRIGLIRRDAQTAISAVRSLNELKALRTGVASGWSSRKVMEANGFKPILSENFETLLKMLVSGRIDYFPRGMNEVFVEYDDRAPANPELAIESNLLIEYPLPGYIFVSPKAPRLHQRLTDGLESMVHDGTLLKLVKEYHADMIRRADFCRRRVFHLNNPFVSDKTPLARKELWFNPYDPKTGICPVDKSKPAGNAAAGSAPAPRTQ